MGLKYKGVFYAGEGEKVTLTPAYTGSADFAFCCFTASAGSLAQGTNGS